MSQLSCSPISSFARAAAVQGDCPATTLEVPAGRGSGVMMKAPSLTLNFLCLPTFKMDLTSPAPRSAEIPEWTRLSTLPCPGNKVHGPPCGYCRLGMEIEQLVRFFAPIPSTARGVLIYRLAEDREFRMNSDAQTIFFSCVWFVLFYSQCSVFKFGQAARRHHLPSNSVEDVFHTLFSVFLVHECTISGAEKPCLVRFRSYIEELNKVLHNLLERMRVRHGLTADSTTNGLVIFINILMMVELDLDDLYKNLVNG
jgi:hypothetical protein